MNKYFKFTLNAILLLTYSLVLAQTNDAPTGGIGVILRDLLVTGGLVSSSLIGAFGALVPRLGLSTALESLLVRSVGSVSLPTNPVAAGLAVVGIVLSFGILYEGGAEQSFLVAAPAVHQEAKIFRESVNKFFADDSAVTASPEDSGSSGAQSGSVSGDSQPSATAPSSVGSGSRSSGSGGSGDSVASNPAPIIKEVDTPPYLPLIGGVVRDIARDYSDGSNDRKVAYDDALAKANKIADGISAQITSKFPDAKSVTDIVSPIIAQMLATQFADGIFFSHTFDTLKKQILDIITAEINKQYSDPNVRQVALGIADQIATQMAEQFLADPNLDAVQLTLVAKRNRLVYDQDVLDVIKGLKEVQNDPNRITPYMFSGSVAGEWTGTLKAQALQGCTEFNSTWSGFWYESDQPSSVSDPVKGSFYEVTGSFGGEQNPFSRTGKGYARITGQHYRQTKNGVSLEFQFFSNEINGFKGAKFTGDIHPQNPVSGSQYDNAVSGNFLAVCPNNSAAGTAGIFTGRRLKSDMTGPWEGTSSINDPVTCKATNTWNAQLSEFKGDVFGMFTQGDEKYEARGIYDSASKETIWIAGDYAFLGLVNNGKMIGTMLGPNCASGINSAGGKDRQGTFEADLGMRNIKYSLPTPVQQLVPTASDPTLQTSTQQIQTEGFRNLPNYH